MLTIQGNRRVRMCVTINKIEGSVCTLVSRIFVENELTQESTHIMTVTDSITQEFSLNMDGTPLMQADLLALMRGESPR